MILHIYGFLFSVVLLIVPLSVVVGQFFIAYRQKNNEHGIIAGLFSIIVSALYLFTAYTIYTADDPFVTGLFPFYMLFIGGIIIAVEYYAVLKLNKVNLEDISSEEKRTSFVAVFFNLIAALLAVAAFGIMFYHFIIKPFSDIENIVINSSSGVVLEKVYHKTLTKNPQEQESTLYKLILNPYTPSNVLSEIAEKAEGRHFHGEIELLMNPNTKNDTACKILYKNGKEDTYITQALKEYLEYGYTLVDTGDFIEVYKKPG